MNIKVSVDASEVITGLQMMGDTMVRAAKETVDYGLNEIEQEQILRYTSTGHPARPPGSTYIRTFKLRRSSRKRPAVGLNNGARGVWWADPSSAPYAPFVLGRTAQQAPIHTGRWKSLEDVVQAVAPRINKKLADKIAKLIRWFNNG